MLGNTDTTNIENSNSEDTQNNIESQNTLLFIIKI